MAKKQVTEVVRFDAIVNRLLTAPYSELRLDSTGILLPKISLRILTILLSNYREGCPIVRV